MRMLELLGGIIGGLIIGFVSSAITWYMLFRRIVPTLEFFPKIYRQPTNENPSGYKYHIRFRNTGRREILDLELFARLRIQGLSSTRPTRWKAIYIPVDDARIPKIGSHRRTKKRIAVQLLVKEVDQPARASLPSALSAKCESGTVRLEELMETGQNATLEIVGFGYDSFSGARRVFESVKYLASDIVDER